QRQLPRVDVIEWPGLLGGDPGRDVANAGGLGGAVTALPDDDHVGAVIEWAYEDGLQNPVLGDRLREPLELEFVEERAGLVRVRLEPVEGDVDGHPTADRRGGILGAAFYVRGVLAVL